MAEEIRGIHVRLDIDTNKNTYTLDEECDSFLDAEVRVQQFLDEHRDL